MKPHLLTALSLAASCLSAMTFIGCAGSDRAEREILSFSATIDHDYFPLEPGSYREYEGTEDGFPRREEEHTLKNSRVITGIPCTGVQQVVYLDDELAEITVEWYSQDAIGNVWKLGEETIEWIDGEFRRSPDSWMAGDGQVDAWIAVPAHPTPGDRFFGHDNESTDEFLVLSVTATESTPVGTFHDCLALQENPDDPNDSDIILYGRGIGRLSEKSRGGKIVLVRRPQK